MLLNRFNITVAVLLRCAPLGRAQEIVRWQANPRAVERSTREHPDFNCDEANVRPHPLPDLLGAAGTKKLGVTQLG